MRNKKHLFSLLFFSFSLFLSAQSLDEAKELYKIGEYNKALPIFEKEYNTNQSDASLNHWLGVCIYETGGDLNKAAQFIQVAANKNIPDAFLYLGNIYTKMYRLEEAHKEYTKYSTLKKRDKIALAKLEKDKAHLSFLEKAISRTENIQIIDSIVVDKDDLLSAYKLSVSSGHIEMFGQTFQTNKNVDATVYFNEKKNKIYYAQPETKDKYSLFSMEKLLSGFANEKKISDNNFELSGNLNYPFVMPDGETIYFSAQDKDGLGGYDIYITRYDTNNDTYLTPEKLNMPFNSIYNDYLMVIDEEKGIGWFATDRFQPENKVCVYTFIPNSQVQLIDSESIQYKANRARITSIKDSWSMGKDYQPIIQLARKEVELPKETIKDFEFVINDEYTYYTYADFKSEQARNMFFDLNKLKRDLNELETELQKLRASYSSNRNLASSILKLENKQEKMYSEIMELEVNTRNQEIKYLKQ